MDRPVPKQERCHSLSGMATHSRVLVPERWKQSAELRGCFDLLGLAPLRHRQIKAETIISFYCRTEASTFQLDGEAATSRLVGSSGCREENLHQRPRWAADVTDVIAL